MAERCARCLFRDCLCGVVPRIDNRTRVVIVRHHLERLRASNSGRLANFALANSELVDHGGGAPTVMPPLGEGAYLVFPAGPVADAAPTSPPVRTLIVLDATWSQARRMFRKLDALRGIPVLRLPEGAAVTNDRMREAPSADRVSTIEAIAAALRLVEGDAVASPLVTLFGEACRRAAASGRRVRNSPTLAGS